MRRRAPTTIGLLASVAILTGTGLAEDLGQSWPRFRGPNASGIAEGHSTPVAWDVETGSNVRWRTAIPGLAHSSPIVWGDSVYLTSAVSAEGESLLKVGLYGSIGSVPTEPVQRFALYRINKRTGAVVWERTAHEGVPRRKRHHPVLDQQIETAVQILGGIDQTSSPNEQLHASSRCAPESR